MWTDNVTCMIRYDIHTLINLFLNFKLYYVFVILPTFILNYSLSTSILNLSRDRIPTLNFIQSRTIFF